MRSPGLLTLWKDAKPPERIPAYPTYGLKRAQGGETTFDIGDSLDLGNGKTRILTEEREAKPEEFLRDTVLRFLPDWTENMRFRLLVAEAAGKSRDLQQLQIEFCRSSILYFANTWCWTFDPRLPAGDKIVPMVTYPIQDDLLQWLVGLVHYQREGLAEKSRDIGASWTAVVGICWLVLFYDGMETHLMSMREDDVDDGTPRVGSLFGKVRFLLDHLPVWMRGGWERDKQSLDKKMFVQIPETHSTVTGLLSRSTAGRSDRTSLLVPDEFAFVEESEGVLDAIGDLGGAKCYISTANGAGNAFHRMAHEPGANKLRMHWSDHPLKNPDWAMLRRGEMGMSEERWSREHEIAYETSQSGRVFPQFISNRSAEFPWHHVQSGDLVTYEPAYPTYTTNDFGVSDPCATIWAQIKPAPPEFLDFTDTTLVFFEEHQARDMTAFDLRWLINSKGRHYRQHIGDKRSGEQRDSSNRSWVKNLADPQPPSRFSKFYKRTIIPGPPVIMDGRRDREEETLETFRILLDTPGAIAFSEMGCPGATLAMQNWGFPIDKETREPKTDQGPKHDQWSHYCKAILYLVMMIYGNLARTKGLGGSDSEEWDFPAIQISRYRS